MIMTLTIAGVVGVPAEGNAADFIVYSVYKGLDFGNPGESPPKDFHVNMGSSQGLRAGTTLNVYRKEATYDLQNEKLYKDVTFPIARLKVIHAESGAAIARLHEMLPADKTPVIVPRTVMVGDIVRVAD